MFETNTDRVWEKFGRDEPYFGILSVDKFRKLHLTAENKAEFIRTGSNYLQEILDTIRRNIDPAFTVSRALDFGCGAGRLVIPLASIAQEVTGIDVSDSMLKEAKQNCAERRITNVIFDKSDDDLTRVKGKFDFIHSAFVFQHIRVNRGERIFQKLISHLERGGVCVVQFTYAKDPPTKKIVSVMKRLTPFSDHISNLLRGRKMFSPQMEWNSYDLNRLFLMIQRTGARECHTAFTDHGGDLGIVVYFRMPDYS